MKNIVLTGGPCSGKSTALSSIKESLEERGYKVFIVCESATELINKGIKPFGDNKIDIYEFEKILMKYQLNKERLIRAKARLFENSIILYDRGVMDNKSYLNELEWHKLLSELKLNEAKLLNRYDLVIHLVSVAYDKKEIYTTANNNARSETVDEASLKDALTLNCYLGHNNLKVIDNSTDFEEKISRVKNHIYANLNEPLCMNKQYKFLVDLSKSNLDFIKSRAVKSYIVQTYLKSSDDIDYRVRMKILNGNTSYYLSMKRKLNNEEKIITNRRITKLDYLHYLRYKDNNLDTIEKIRYSFKIEKEVYNLDIVNNNYGILENETTKDINNLSLPDCLCIIDSSNINLNNKEIAKKKVLSNKKHI